jgi:hypothetical protein
MSVKRSATCRGRQRGRRLLVAVTFCFVVLGVTATLVSAGQVDHSWQEDHDAGQTPPHAQAAVGTGALNSIRGSLASGNDVDMFKICAGPDFSATTVGGATFDTQLFLFDWRGVGLYANDDDHGGNSLQSTLPAHHRNGPNIRSEYFLAISEYDRDPVDATLGRASKLIFPTSPFTRVLGRFTDTGPITGWQGSGDEGGHYTISLEDAEFLTAQGHCAPAATSAGGSVPREK